MEKKEFTAKQYFGAHYDIWDEDYISTKYAGQRHTAEEWEAIMNKEWSIAHSLREEKTMEGICKELKEIADILTAEGYRIYRAEEKEIVIRCNTFGTLFKLAFRTPADGWEKDTFVLKSSDELQWYQTTHKGEVLNIIYFVYHCMCN